MTLNKLKSEHPILAPAKKVLVEANVSIGTFLELASEYIKDENSWKFFTPHNIELLEKLVHCLKNNQGN